MATSKKDISELAEEKTKWLIAVKESNPNHTITYLKLPKRALDDEDVAHEAVMLNAVNQDLISPRLRDDHDFIKKILSDSWTNLTEKSERASILFQLSEEVKLDAEFILELAKEFPSIIEFIDKRLMSRKDFIVPLIGHMNHSRERLLVIFNDQATKEVRGDVEVLSAFYQASTVTYFCLVDDRNCVSEEDYTKTKHYLDYDFHHIERKHREEVESILYDLDEDHLDPEIPIETQIKALEENVKYLSKKSLKGFLEMYKDWDSIPKEAIDAIELALAKVNMAKIKQTKNPESTTIVKKPRRVLKY